MKIRTFLSIAAVPALLLAGPALAGSKKDAPITTATSIHGTPGNTPGFGGDPADGANGMHNIDGGAPGQAGYNPTDPGQDPAVSMHGGLRDTTGTDSPLDGNDIP